MCFESGVHSKIYKYFEKNEDKINNLEGGDQVWTGPQLETVYYIDDDFPNMKKNLKFHLAKRLNNQLQLPITVSDDVKLVDCGGRPKPHELEVLPYIKQNWNLV